MQKGFVGLDGFIWWQGVVEDRMDPLKIGRVRVRIFGFHTEDKTLMPTDHLPWANVGLPIDHGTNPVGLRESDWVVGFFRDGIAQQEPIVMFVIPGIPTSSASPEMGFSDPTDITSLSNGEIPRPPEFGTDVNFAASMVTGLQEASKSTLTNFLRDVRPKIPEKNRADLDALINNLPKFDSKSTMNLTQAVLQTPSNIQQIVKQFDNSGVINQIGVEAHRRLSNENRDGVKNGLIALSQLMSRSPQLQTVFQNSLQTSVNQKLSSFVQNNIPQSVRDGLQTLGTGAAINQIISNLSSGGQFNVTQLFNGDIATNVNGIITSLIPINSPLEMIEKLGRDVARQITEFLGLDFGVNDEELVPIELEDERKALDPFANPNKLPIQGTSVGVLQKDFDPLNFPYDMNGDGTYNQADASILIDQMRRSGTGDAEGVTGAANEPIYPHSRYPLEPFLNEPTTSRLARNEKTEETILSNKKRGVQSFASAAYEPIEGLKLSSPTGTTLNPTPKEPKGELDDQAPSEGEPFEEPASPYNAKYPYNHVYASESGHFIEIDDTPKAERLHWYHRSGTFREMHPDGKLVDKCVDESYDIAVGNMFKATQKNLTTTSKESTKIKAGTELVLESGSMAVSTGGISIKSGTTLQDIEGGHGQRISDNKQVEVGGDYLIKTDGKFSVEADTINLKATASIALDAIASHISIRCLGGVVVVESPTVGNNCVEFNATGVANLVPTFSPKFVPNPEPPILPPVEEPEDPTPAQFKPGFVIKFGDNYQKVDGYNVNYLYKPDSDSDGKPVVLCPPGNGAIVMYEALPTGELEELEIEYLYAMGQVTKWPVKRPKHRKGNVIERPRFAGNGNGGRDHYRFSKYAKDYPQQFIIADDTEEFLILDGKIRHD